VSLPTSQSAVALRHAFDRAFAEPPTPRGAADEALVLIRVAESTHALRLDEIGGLHAGRKIAQLPSAAPALLGLVGLRSALAPVYDLRVLLGYPGAAAPRWIAVARGAQPVGLAFDAFERQVRVPLGAISLAAAADAARPHLAGVVRIEAASIPLIHVASIVDAIAGHAGARPPKER